MPVITKWEINCQCFDTADKRIKCIGQEWFFGNNQARVERERDFVNLIIVILDWKPTERNERNERNLK